MTDSSKRLPLELSALEVIYLVDSIRNKDVDEGDPEKPVSETSRGEPIARETLLLLGGVYRELVFVGSYSEETREVKFNEAQIWLLRDKVRTGDLAIDGQTKIGVSLTLKFLDLLSQFNAEIDDLLKEMGVSNEEGSALTKEEVQESLRRRDNHA